MRKNCEYQGLPDSWELDYLSDGSPIFQDKNLYTFSSDSVELAKSVEETEIDSLVDLCSGSGVVGLEIISRVKTNVLYLIEIQKELSNLAEESSKYHKSKTKIIPICDSIRNIKNKIHEGSIDVVTCNPPYFKLGTGKVSDNNSKRIARHETEITLQEIIETASTILKSNGIFYMIHISDRLAEIKNYLSKFGFDLMCEKVLEGKLKRVIIRAKKR